MEPDCLWRPCTARTWCHISLAVSHQRRLHFLIPLHCPQLNQYQRQLPRRSPHAPPPIRVQHLPARRVRYQQQRYQRQRHSPLDRGSGTLSPAARTFGSTDRHLGKTRKTCAGRALPRTMERLDRYRRTPQRKRKSHQQRQRERFLGHHFPRLYAPQHLANRFRMNRGGIPNKS